MDINGGQNKRDIFVVQDVKDTSGVIRDEKTIIIHNYRIILY